MIPNDIHYNFPIAVNLLIFVLVILAILWRLYLFRKKSLEKFASPEILKEVLVPRSRYNFWAKVVAICLAWILVTVALMQPKGNGHYPLEGAIEAAARPKGKEQEVVVRRKAHDVIFLVDASASMDVNDTRTKVTRLDFAKEVVDEIISRLRGESVTLFAFTSDTTKLSPLTMDYLFVRLMLRQMHINEGELAGTNIVEALADMRDSHLAKITPKQKTLVILTDGGDTQLEELTGQERENQINAILNLVGGAEENQLRVFTIGMGTEQGQAVPGVTYKGQSVISSLDEELLKKLSDVGRGQYYFANDWTAMDLAEEVVAKMGEDETLLEEYRVKRRTAITRGKEDLVFDLLFQFPLGLAIFFLALVLFFPNSRTRKKDV
ncbi:MAG: hypothetical protein K940chlam7_00181 [Chlamydiae bacterium]|nr:hypothetical protein [Chlamydiota bacterium]